MWSLNIILGDMWCNNLYYSYNSGGMFGYSDKTFVYLNPCAWFCAF